MALEYFLYRTDFNNTLIDRSVDAFTLGANEGQIQIDFLIPKGQALYLYRESGGTIVENDQNTINSYLQVFDPPDDDGTVRFSDFAAYTGDTSTTLGGLRTDVDENRTIINTLTGSTGGLPVATFNSYTGATSTVLSELRTDVNIISGTTNNNLTNWTFLVTNFDTSPTINGTITQGVVYNYIYDNITRYRFVPTIYDPKEDSFYSGFNGTTLTGKIISRGI
jgi:hypothetical protein